MLPSCIVNVKYLENKDLLLSFLKLQNVCPLLDYCKAYSLILTQYLGNGRRGGIMGGRYILTLYSRYLLILNGKKIFLILEKEAMRVKNQLRFGYFM